MEVERGRVPPKTTLSQLCVLIVNSQVTLLEIAGSLRGLRPLGGREAIKVLMTVAEMSDSQLEQVVC